MYHTKKNLEILKLCGDYDFEMPVPSTMTYNDKLHKSFNVDRRGMN